MLSGMPMTYVVSLLQVSPSNLCIHFCFCLVRVVCPVTLIHLALRMDSLGTNFMFYEILTAYDVMRAVCLLEMWGVS